jgi:hypothetical protein
MVSLHGADAPREAVLQARMRATFFWWLCATRRWLRSCADLLMTRVERESGWYLTTVFLAVVYCFLTTYALLSARILSRASVGWMLQELFIHLLYELISGFALFLKERNSSNLLGKEKHVTPPQSANIRYLNNKKGETFFSRKRLCRREGFRIAKKKGTMYNICFEMRQL